MFFFSAKLPKRATLLYKNLEDSLRGGGGDFVVFFFWKTFYYLPMFSQNKTRGVGVGFEIFFFHTQHTTVFFSISCRLGPPRIRKPYRYDEIPQRLLLLLPVKKSGFKTEFCSCKNLCDKARSQKPFWNITTMHIYKTSLERHGH